MNSLARIGRTVGVTLLIAASLLTFPSSNPWMFAVWLAWTTVSLVRTEGKGSAYYPLAIGFGVLLIKRIPSSPALLVLSISATIAFLCTSWYGRRETAHRKLAVVAAALWIAWAAFSWDWHAAASCNHPVAMHASRPVVLLGDSLTAGVRPVGGYDRDLAKLISLPLVNLGEEGATSTSALKRLPELLNANPQAVVLELGGNDFIRGESRETVQRNLEAIIAAADKIGAEVVIVEIPRGFVTDPYRGLERDWPAGTTCSWWRTRRSAGWSLKARMPRLGCGPAART